MVQLRFLTGTVPATTFMLLLLSARAGFGAPLKMSVSKSGTNAVMTWPAWVSIPGNASVFPEYTLQRSSDLSTWEPFGGKLIGIPGTSGPMLNTAVGVDHGPHFFRLLADPAPTSQQELVGGGADVFGYNSELANQLSQLGSLSLAGFTNMYPQPNYLPQISFDPTTAQFWTNFNTDPAVWAAQQPTNAPSRTWNDFRLNSNEMALFMTNGFVVSERMGSVSFAQSYYRIFSDDLPVFITSDSVLQAWHRTYDGMVEELEELEMATLMEDILTSMAGTLPSLYGTYQDQLALQGLPPGSPGPLNSSFLDADFYLTVARSLWAGTQVTSSLGNPAVDQQVSTALTAVAGQRLLDFDIFGTSRWIDFSQFIVRGHYQNSVRLSRYFKTMMWCQIIELRLAYVNSPYSLSGPEPENFIRQFGTAIVVNSLLAQSGASPAWASMDQIGRAFFGVTDSMTLFQFADLLATANIHWPWDITDLSTITNLQTRMLTGELAFPIIDTDLNFAASGESPVRLPGSVTLFGQKFVMDSWAMIELTYDRTQPLVRRKSSGLDVAFSVLANDQAVPALVARMEATNGVAFRDGLQYQTNIAAVRSVIDARGPALWTNNVYTAWLDALRILSTPTTAVEYPEAMRTHAWAMKTLTTQVASWTELRHDTILYDQQAYTTLIICGYPDGFVEPLPEFWNQMRNMSDIAAAAISSFPLTGSLTLPARDPNDPIPVGYNLGSVQSAEYSSLKNFSAQMTVLEDMAKKELAQLPFSHDETNFIKSVMESTFEPYYGVSLYTGWYPGLFYANVFQTYDFNQTEGSDRWDALVVDIDTDLFDDLHGDPGAVINDSVGNVHMLMIAVDNGTNRMVYAGPVLSHYEFETPLDTRLTDDQWQVLLRSGQQPLPPEWTQGYLVPGDFSYPPGF